MNCIGIDIGGTKVAAGVFNHEGHLLHDQKYVPGTKKGEDVLSACRKLIKELFAACDSNISAIGICIPGIVNPQTGHVWAPNIDGWTDIPLAEYLTDTLPSPEIPIVVENDRTASLMGEWWCGSAHGYGNVVFVAVGTGIGVGIMANEAILQGTMGGAGSMGWCSVGLEHCGSFSHSGCYEYYAAGPGIAEAARRMIKTQHSYSGVLKSCEDGCLTTSKVFEACDIGDPIACAVIDNCVKIWGTGAANLISLLNPDILVFGGGVFGPAAKYINEITEEARRWAQPVNMMNVRITASALGSKAALYGTARCALKIAEET